MWRFVRAVLIGGAIGTPLVSVLVANNALHIWERSRPDAALAEELARGTASGWEDVRVTAGDGTVLDGWIFTPKAANGAAVIVLHGVSDSRAGMLGHARFLLHAGYTVLAPDLRGHGVSGGELITYGVREADDVHAWADWLFRNRQIQRLYGLGVSMGAAILLESLPREPRLQAVVAESPFATFEEIAFDRMSQTTGMPGVLFWPVVRGGFVWTRLRYGVDLRKASPLDAVRRSQVPMLLIHGLADDNIPIRHSRELWRSNPAAAALWEVPGADHVQCLATAPHEYIRRVLLWFATPR